MTLLLYEATLEYNEFVLISLETYVESCVSWYYSSLNIVANISLKAGKHIEMYGFCFITTLLPQTVFDNE